MAGTASHVDPLKASTPGVPGVVYRVGSSEEILNASVPEPVLAAAEISGGAGWSATQSVILLRGESWACGELFLKILACLSWTLDKMGLPAVQPGVMSAWKGLSRTGFPCTQSRGHLEGFSRSLQDKPLVLSLRGRHTGQGECSWEEIVKGM